MEKVLVTGTAGFIGFHLTQRLVLEGFDVLGLDVINDYYDISLKYARLETLGIESNKIKLNVTMPSSLHDNLRFIRADLAKHDFIVNMMRSEKFDYVINLAAQAGVRYSIDNPLAYTHSNVDAFLSVLEGARHSKVKHVIYASQALFTVLIQLCL
jgi:UDP-glucuronate 4-epimerase